jgi:hypothetical protein
MGGRTVEVEVVLLDVFAVVALAVCQPEQAFLEDRVLAVPQSQGEAESLLVIGNAGQAVLAPTVSARAGLVVAEVIPGIAAFAIVFADRPPIAVRSGTVPTSSRATWVHGPLRVGGALQS